jgi:exopolyphosphatase/guanosine-5'-triphosphate,3'-diphosphate pyrophosphatase
MARRVVASGPVAVIDIGSNSGRVIVYRREGGGHLQILAGSRAPLRLVRGVDRSGRIEPEALDRTFHAIADFQSIARGAGAERTMAVGTSALRDATNGPAFIGRVRRELGIDLRILSGVEEGRYGFLGAVNGLPAEHGVLFDLGGGSLQLARFHGRRMLGAASLPLGALRVSGAFLRSDPPAPREIRRLHEHIRKALAEAGTAPLAEGECLVGTGGTLRNLARIDQRASGYPLARLHGYLLTRRRVQDITARLAGMRVEKRGRVPGLNEDRRDSVVGGGVVIDSLMDVLGAGEVLVSGQGVREGVALSLVGESLEPPETVRATSLDALAARFSGWSSDRARRRQAAATALFRSLEGRPSPEVREALAHAARILDIGRTVDFFDRHEHVADLVVATDLGGFSHRQVALLSAILRRAGDEHTPDRLLTPLVRREDRKAVERAAVLLDLADQITERCPPGTRTSVDCRVRAGEAIVSVSALASWGVRGLTGRFERAFERRLRVVPGSSKRG